jgi:hypothetical protein
MGWILAILRVDLAVEQAQKPSMPKKKEPPLSAEEQRKRFEELARESGARTSSKDMREALKRAAQSDAGKTKSR